MQTNFLKMCILLILSLQINCVLAQEIPSRVNEGVVTSQKREGKKDVYNGINLSTEQRKQLKMLISDSRNRAKEITADSTLTEKQKREQIAVIKASQTQKQKSILTADQYARYEQNRRDSKSGRAPDEQGNVTNRAEKNDGKDANGLSGSNTEKASKKGRSASGDLKLTAEQRDQMKLASDEYNMQVRLIRDNSSMAADERRTQLRTAYQQYDMQVSSILTAEQKAEWNDKQRRARLTMPSRQLQNDKNKKGKNF